MKADLVSILADVTTPTDVSRSFIECVKQACAGTDEDCILRDRGDGEDSTTCIVFPNKLWCSRLELFNVFRLSATKIRQQQPDENQRGESVGFHVGLFSWVYLP